MQLTKHTDFGLRTLIYLALHPGRRVSTAEVAAVFGVPQNHLSKVVGQLASGGFVRTFRGKGGGSMLEMPLDDIRVGAVVRHLEGEKEMINCARPLCPAVPACSLIDVMQQAKAACLEVLDRYSLGDVVNDRRQELDLLLTPTPPVHAHARPN